MLIQRHTTVYVNIGIYSINSTDDENVKYALKYKKKTLNFLQGYIFLQKGKKHTFTCYLLHITQSPYLKEKVYTINT